MTCCPNCRSAHYKTGLIDERPYREAARQAPYLRHFGETNMAANLLAELYAVRIKNFTALRWHCLSCGVRFDG